MDLNGHLSCANSNVRVRRRDVYVRIGRMLRPHLSKHSPSGRFDAIVDLQLIADGTGESEPVNYEQLRIIVCRKPMDEEDAQRFAHFATREVVDARRASVLYDDLVLTLGNMNVAHWLGPDVAEALRQRAVRIIDEIEIAATPPSRRSKMGR